MSASWLPSHFNQSTLNALYTRLPKSYPKLAPQIILEKVHGVSGPQLSALHELLRATAKSLLGSEMIYELATAASTYLTENNTAVRFGKSSSLKEDRAKREEEAEQIAATQALLNERVELDEKAKQDSALLAEIEANERRREELREERLRMERDALTGEAADVHHLAVIERFERALRLPGNLHATIVVKGAVMSQSKSSQYSSHVCLILTEEDCPDQLPSVPSIMRKPSRRLATASDCPPLY